MKMMMDEVFLSRLNRRKGVFIAMGLLVLFGLAIHMWGFYFAEAIEALPTFKDPSAEQPAQKTSPVPDPDDMSGLMHALWKPFLHDLNETKFVSKEGYNYEIAKDNYRWTKPLGKKLLILDVDTRIDEGAGAMMNTSKLNPKEMVGRTGGMMNHYLYAMIHGYDYRFIRAPNYSDRHGTWVKVPMIQEALKTHEFVVFLDADAVFMYPHMPFEWLMSLWNITDNTLVAMASDPDSPRNRDHKGKPMWNTGFVVARQSERTQELFTNWEACPTEKKYDGCKKWAKDWAHEQAAFANYVRYDYNSDEELRPIPCMDGNGAPYIGDKSCGGVFVRHHWFHKDYPVGDLQQAIIEAMVNRLHDGFHQDKKKTFLDASNKSYPLNRLQV
ncbi:hypothetical protein Neosp_012322 [[Neocosmospora] mangrovei]